MNEIVILTGIALILSILLVLLDNLLNKKDINKEEVDYSKFLPGYNCGACGYGSCQGMAIELAKDPTIYIKCKPMKKEEKENLEKLIKEQ
jgi:Uncharacterized protein conserved in archaea